MSTTVWFLTSNPGKLEEAQHHFKELGIEVKGLDLPEDTILEPQAGDLETVARSKLAQALAHLPYEGAMVMVEDAGLFVDALDGFPGVYSSFAFFSYFFCIVFVYHFLLGAGDALFPNILVIDDSNLVQAN